MLATTSATFLMTDKWTRAFLRPTRTQFPPTPLFIPAVCCTACNHLMNNLDSLSQQIACTLLLVATSTQESPASPAEPFHLSSGWIYIQGFPFCRLVATSRKEDSSSPAYRLNGKRLIHAFCKGICTKVKLLNLISLSNSLTMALPEHLGVNQSQQLNNPAN